MSKKIENALAALEETLVSCNRFNYCYQAVTDLKKAIAEELVVLEKPTDNELPKCTCQTKVCGHCHAGMNIPRSYFPELAKEIDKPTKVEK